MKNAAVTPSETPKVERSNKAKRVSPDALASSRRAYVAQRISALDSRLGVGIGAKRERNRLALIIANLPKEGGAS